MSVDFRGFPACTCLAEWLPVYERELQRRGILDGALHIFQLIGGNPSSGGTHLTGGAFDVEHFDGMVWVARQMGADATWFRPFNWDGFGGTPHEHGVLRGCPHLSPSAAAQIIAVGLGGDGLAGDAPDTGPRPLSGRTFREGIAWQLQQEALMVTPEDEARIRAIFREEIALFAKSAGETIKVDGDGDPSTPKVSLERKLQNL